MDAEQTAANLLVAQAFEQLGIRYLLGGSMASSVHGIYRATADANFVAAIRPIQSAPLADLVKSAFYADTEAIRAAVISGRSFNLIHLDTMLKIDVFPASNLFHREQLRRRILQAIGPDEGQALYLATAEDTILSKLKWYREGGEVSERQWNDVLGVLKVQKQRLDASYLRQWAKNLQLTDLLDKASLDAGVMF